MVQLSNKKRTETTKEKVTEKKKSFSAATCTAKTARKDAATAKDACPVPEHQELTLKSAFSCANSVTDAKTLRRSNSTPLSVPRKDLTSNHATCVKMAVENVTTVKCPAPKAVTK